MVLLTLFLELALARERRQATVTEPSAPINVEPTSTTAAKETTAAETTAAKADETTKGKAEVDATTHGKDDGHDHSSAAVAGATACLLTTLFSL